MSIQAVDYIWKNGSLIPWAEATVHVLSHGLHYGTSIFEGIRVYATPKGPMGFRVSDHLHRMHDSARIYGIKIPYTEQELMQACRDAVRANGLGSAYLRPIAFIGYSSLGVVPPADSPIDVVVAAFPWGAYLGDEGLSKGVDVCVSSWNRLAPNTMPAGAKAGGNYLSSYLISREAKQRGFAEGIGLGRDGLLSEGAGENLFLVKDNKLMTPPVAASILHGITRDTIITLAKAEGLEIVEQVMPREMLYNADEIFFTGTAAEITPIRSVDGIATTAAGAGPVTKRLQEMFFGLFTGTTKDEWGWLEPMLESVSDQSAEAETPAQERESHVKASVGAA